MVSIKRLPAPILESYEWQWHGSCMGKDAAVFFSPEAERGRKRQRREENAKRICASCPVLERCREHALNAQEAYGVWGGLTEAERAEIIHLSQPKAS